MMKVSVPLSSLLFLLLIPSFRLRYVDAYYPPIPSQVFPMPYTYNTGNTSLAICPGIPFTITCQLLMENGNRLDCPDPIATGIQRYQNIIFFAGAAGSNTPTSNPFFDDDQDDILSYPVYTSNYFSDHRPVLTTTLTTQHGRRKKDIPLSRSFFHQSSVCLSSLSITIRESAPLSPLVNESYILQVPDSSSTATLTAPNQWGALRGLESFSQLIIWQGPDVAYGDAYLITNTPIYIYDEPRFHYRGVLIDTSFNFLTVQAIKKVLDSMPVMKANILHWHVVDDPSWPLESLTYPNLTRGAYVSTAIYTVQDQEDLSMYAWERGVSIFLEFDGPGHSTSFGYGSPSFVSACDGHQTLMDPTGEIDDGESVYYALSKLIDEFYPRISARGNIPWIHFGGDEVTDYTCWLTSPEVQQWATKIGINGSDPVAIRSAFTYRVEQIGKRKNLTVLFWEETFTGNFNSSASSVICPWVTPEVGGDAVAQGHDIMVYVGYYLDQWVPPAKTNQWYQALVDYAYEDSLNLLYAFDAVFSTNVSVNSQSKVLGGVASAWGDNVDSSLGATTMLYPRGLGIGEKLWSPAAFTMMFNDPTSSLFDIIDARVEHARCKLVQRGIGAPPLGLAGDYGLCWIPEWNNKGGNNPIPEPIVSNDIIRISSGSFAGSIVGAGIVGALAVWILFNGSSFMRSVVQYAAVPKGIVETNTVTATRKSTGYGGTETGTDNGNPPAARVDISSPSPSSAPRVLALDQLRGITMWCMLFVNLYYGYNQLPPFFSHGITYFSGPDLIEPLFHFCVGFALRLVILKRMGKAIQERQIFRYQRSLRDEMDLSRETWSKRYTLFLSIFKVRVVGLILLSMFFTEGWGQFNDWNKITGFADWLGSLVQNNQPYHTLLHIAFLTVYTFIPMTMGSKIRFLFMIGTILLLIILQATFYFRWIRDYNLDEGGYFGFLGWSIEALTGSFAYDIVAWCNSTNRTEPNDREREKDKNSTETNIRVSLLAESHMDTTTSNNHPKGNSNEGLRTVPSPDNATFTHPVRVWTPNPKRNQGIRFIGTLSIIFMLIGYFLSCLGSVWPLTKCYDGQRIFFWGGFGNDADCSLVPKYGGFFVNPPFYLPDPGTNIVTMWTMTQRAGSPTYHIWASGTSLFFFMLLYFLCEEGITVSTNNWLFRYPRGIEILRKGFGLHLVPVKDSNYNYNGKNSYGENTNDTNHGDETNDDTVATANRLLLYWHVAEVFGENPLAVYLIGDSVADNVGNMLPLNCPAWYFLLWGEVLYIGICYIAAVYLRKHKLFLRL